MSDSRIERRHATLPFWRRGLVVLLVIGVVGPLLGALVLPSIEAVGSLASGFIPTFADFMDELELALGLTLMVGVPFAFTAGLIVALIVSRRGTISYGESALIGFLVPCVLSVPVLGGLFVLAPFIGLATALIAVAMRAVVGWIARRFAGVVV